jgi:Protein of unknown function (DUF1131)
MIGLLLALALPIAADSVGPLNAETPFTRAAIAKLFPGLKVRKTTDGYEDMSWPTVSVFRGEKELLRIDSCDWTTHICRVRIFAAEALTSDGVRRGQLHKAIHRKLHFTRCFAGAEQEADLVFCASARSPFGYVFENKTNAYDEDVPIEKLASCPLLELRWSTPGTANRKH